MKKTILFIVLLLTFGAFAQDNPDFDAEMAKKVKADEYGMKQYYMVYLKAGAKHDQDSATAANIQRAHMDNIMKLANEGKLIVAGPFLDKGDVRGIFILDAATMEEAMQLTQTDPAVQSGRLVMEVHPWYGSAALMMVPDLHKKVAKKEI
jgi:uncharacterized protein YciI